MNEHFKIAEPFSILFPKRPLVVNAIKEHMEEYGFDSAFPLVLAEGPWTDEPVLIDGHTRLEVADDICITNIPTITKFFKTEDDALEYAIHNQRDRRSLTDTEIFSCLEVLNQRKQRGGLRDMAVDPDTGRFTAKAPSGANADTLFEPPAPTDQSFIPTGKSSVKAAEMLGISPRKVERARAVMAEDTPPEIKKAVLSGEKSINRAYEEVREIKKNTPLPQKKETPYKPTFNETNDNIEWAKWSWNPVTGCRHGCKYCYARDIANRFYNEKFDYTVHRNRLTAPLNTNIPDKRRSEAGINNVFVCSMADLFGEWVETEVIQEVLDTCAASPQWNYLFLTKNPRRLLEFVFPENSWVGTTVDVQSRVDDAVEIMPQVKAPIKFISCEPFLEDLGFNTLEGIDWVIIGGCSQTSGGPAIQPQWKWVEDLLWTARDCGCKVYFKTNLETRPKEYPKNNTTRKEV